MTRISLLLIFVALAAVTSTNGQRNDNRGKRIGFTLDNQFREEESDGAGGVLGEYGVRTGDGCMRVTRYKATKRGGFKVISTRKEDCDPKRVVSRLRPAAAPRPKHIAAAAPRPKHIAAARTTTTPSRVIKPQTKQSTQAPIRPSKPHNIAPSHEEIVVPLHEEIVVPANEPIAAVQQDLPRIVTTSRPKVTKAPKQKKKGKNKNRNKSRRNRPKQLKKDFDFKALSKGNPARALDKKDDPVYSFGFTAPGHGHTQSGAEDGSKKGEYYFDSPDGWRRIVTYVANKKGFFPKMRRIRIPGWTSTTPAPRVPRNRNKNRQSGDDQGGEGSGKANNGGDGNGGSGGVGGNGGTGSGTGGKGGSGGSGGSGGTGGDADLSGKQLLASLQSGGVGSCPYYFFYNTKVNFHWERCMENGTKVGQYGLLHEDGFSYRTSYYADVTGYHPKSTKIPLTDEQTELVHQFTEGVFILPKTDEERRDTEERILKWMDDNRELLKDPLAG